MKKLKICLINIILSTLLIAFHTSLISKVNLHTFNTEKVINRIEYLTSDELEGRLSGSKGNFLAQDFIVNDFKKNNLLPYKLNYLHSFNTYYPKELNDSPYLKITDKKGNVVKNYEYNRDFKDAFLNFKANKISITNSSNVTTYPSAFLVKNPDGNTALFISAEMSSFNFRSSFVYDSSFDLYTLVSPKIFNEILDFYNKGYNFECYFPYEVEEVKINNVAGIIKGKNPFLPPLVLTAHFDHLGKDLSGNIYRGALDNASGIAFIMELASYLSTLPMPDRDIIFVGLNAEEFGLLGAESFANTNIKDLSKSKVINFDMIGSDHNIPIALVTGQDPKDKKQLLENLTRHCEDKNIVHLIESKDSSDHAGFLNAGIDSVTINDADVSRIHTTQDNVEYISPSAIDRSFSLVWTEIYNSAYKNAGLFMLDTKILILVFIMCILICYFSLNTKED